MSHQEQRIDGAPDTAVIQSIVGKLELNHGYLAVVRAVCTSASRAIAQHPRRLTAVVAAMLLGAGSLSIASLAPDASDLAVSQIVESVESQPVQAQIEQLADFTQRLYRSDLTRSNDTADTCSNAWASTTRRRQPICAATR